MSVREKKLLDKIEELNIKVEAGMATSQERELFDYLCSTWCAEFN